MIDKVQLVCQFMEVVGVAILIRNTYHVLPNCVSILSFSLDVSSLM